MKQYGAEFFGTFWLVLRLRRRNAAAGVPELGIGYLGVALAFGLSVLTMAYAIGPISGAHLNPAVSVGLWVGGRFPASQLLPMSSPRSSVASPAACCTLIASGPASTWPPASPPTATVNTRRAATRCKPRWSAKWYLPACSC